MVWARGKNKGNMFMKIFILCTIAHFIYEIKIWLGETLEIDLK